MADPTLDMTNMSAADLRRVFIKRRLPSSEKFRTFFGRATDMDRILMAMRQADYGLMVELTDLESEVLGLDPHLSSVLSKRFRSVQCLDWDLELPTGPDVDKKEAQLIADKVRGDIKRVPFFGERLYDMMWANYDGRAVLENHWERSQHGRFPWRICELRWVHPRRIGFGPRRELRIIDPMQLRGDFEPDGFAVDNFPGKFLWWQPRHFREYPEREGLAPRCLYWAFFKRFSWRNRMIWTELFGVPWRIVEQDKDAQGEDVEDLKDMAENLGQESTAAFPPGIKLNIASPDGEHSEIFSMNHDQVNQEMSKLVLGATGTTDAEANRAESIVHKNEQDIILEADAGGLGERVDHFFVRPTTIMNFGKDSLPNAPRFKLKAEPPRDQQKEQERADKAIQIGVPVAVAQYREITGMREPEPDEAIIVAESGGVDAMGNPMPATTKIVQPGEKLEPLSVDQAAERAPALESGGVEQANKNAEQQLVAASRSDDLISMPFAGYDDFDACVIDQKAQGHDEESARRICGKLQDEAEAARRDLEQQERDDDGMPPMRW